MASISSFISVVNQHVEMKGWDLPHWRGKMNIGFSLTLVALSSMSAFETKDFKWHDMKYVMGKAIGKKKKSPVPTTSALTFVSFLIIYYFFS